MLYFIFVLLFAQKIKAVTIDIDAGIDLGPQWKYEYQIQPVADPEESPAFRTQRKSLVADMAVAAGSQIFDILKNIQLEDDKKDDEIELSEFAVEPKAQEISTTEKAKKNHHKRKKDHKRKRDNESETDNKRKTHSKNRHHRDRHTEKLTTTTRREQQSQERKKSKPTRGKSKLTREKSKKLKKLRTNKNRTKKTESETLEESKSKEIANEKHKKKTTKKQKKHSKRKSISIVKTTPTATTKKVLTTTIIPIVPKNDDIFVKAIRVKDDPTLTEHIQYIYKQSLKVFDDLKNKVDNYKLKNEIKFLARSYDEKYKEFVKEHKYHLIKSRLGKKKVILNAVETSNKILDRLVGYLKSKVEEKGLRSSFPSIFERALTKKIDLENKRMCKKFGLCRQGKGFRHFLIDALTIVLNSEDTKLIQMNDAFTEVLKNRDFSHMMDSRTQKHFLRSIRDFENYNVDVLKPIFYIVRNVLSNINEPLKVTTKDRSVNKTVAFIEIIDIFEEKMPPDEVNRLSWEDSLNALRAWSKNDRYDVTDMVESFVDQMKKTMQKFDSYTSSKIERNMNILMS